MKSDAHPTKAPRDFYIHLVAFMALTPILLAINILSASATHLWAWWVFVSWGTVLYLHTSIVFSLFNIFSDDDL